MLPTTTPYSEMPCNSCRELTQSERGSILALHAVGYTYRQIASEFNGISLDTVHTTIKHDQEHHTTKSLPRSGRPSVISPHSKRAVIRALRANRFSPYKAVVDEIGTVTACQVMEITHRNDYNQCIAVRKPFLNAGAFAKWITWAEDNEETNWMDATWTDEAKMETGEHPGCT